MGLGFASSSSSYENQRAAPVVNVKNINNIKISSDKNPNPKNFKVIKSEVIGRFLIVKVNYPNCTNYEGDKILVFRDIALSDLLSKNKIDPHFFPNKYSPVARFVPTLAGWTMAVAFCKTYNVSKVIYSQRHKKE